MEACSVGTWKPYSSRPIAHHVRSIYAEVSRVYETNRWSQLPGVGHTGASDKNIRASKTSDTSVLVSRASPLDERREIPRRQGGSRGASDNFVLGWALLPMPRCAKVPK